MSEETEQSASKTISIKVAEQIAASTPSIVGKVVDSLATAEIERRANALLVAVNAATDTQRELYKIKPDQVTYKENGDVASEGYTKAKLEEKKKLTEKLTKIDGAIKKAVDGGDFSAVLNLKG